MAWKLDKPDPEGVALDHYLTHLDNLFSPASAYTYSKCVSQLRTWMKDQDKNSSLLTATKAEVERFIARGRTKAHRKASPYTIKREQVVLRHLFAFLHAEGYRDSNLLVDMEVVRLPRALPKPVDRAKVKLAIRHERNPRYRLVLLLASDAGLRRGEIASLRWGGPTFTSPEFLRAFWWSRARATASARCPSWASWGRLWLRPSEGCMWCRTLRVAPSRPTASTRSSCELFLEWATTAPPFTGSVTPSAPTPSTLASTLGSLSN